jgi:hypothetical protein
MADMNLTQAAEEVRKMLRGFQAAGLVSAALEHVGSLQNAGKEAEKALEDIRTKIVASAAELASAQAEVAAAKEDVRKVTADAKRKADDRMAKVEAEIAVRVSDAGAVVAAAVARAESIEASAIAAKTGVIEARGELEDLIGKIAKAKAGVAKILGG